MEAHFSVNDYCSTARELVPKMRQAGANVIIGITHLFMAQDKKWRLCRSRFILGGHEHTLLQSSANGTPIFKMWADAREVGNSTSI